MTDEAPPEALDSSLSSGAKDAFFANDPNEVPPTTEGFEAPEEHKHHSYDVKARNAEIEDADFEVPETNRKGGEEDE